MLTVVKVGGSLSQHPEKLTDLCLRLSELAKKHPLVVVPGGGEFADLVRKMDKRFSLSAKSAHKMAILGMDQYGLLLSDLIPNCQVTYKLDAAERFSSSVRLTVFLTSHLLFKAEPLENSWDVTSDSIAFYVAGMLSADQVLLVKDVDGIFSDDPKITPNAKLKEKVNAKELLSSNMQTSVDRYLPKLILKTKIPCYVVNGLYSDRVEALLDGQDTICTQITP
jgi:aspartokinase-like uncharacterized kinase